MTKYKHLPEWAQEIAEDVERGVWPPSHIERLLQSLDDALAEKQRYREAVISLRGWVGLNDKYLDEGGYDVITIPAEEVIEFIDKVLGSWDEPPTE